MSPRTANREPNAAEPLGHYLAQDSARKPEQMMQCFATRLPCMHKYWRWRGHVGATRLLSVRALLPPAYLTSQKQGVACPTKRSRYMPRDGGTGTRCGQTCYKKSGTHDRLRCCMFDVLIGITSSFCGQYFIYTSFNILRQAAVANSVVVW